MGDTIIDGGAMPAPVPTSGPTILDGPPAYAGPVWGQTIIEESIEVAKAFAAFRVVKGSGAGRLFDLRFDADTRIGRDASLNDVVMSDSKVSAQQVIIRGEGLEFSVIDLGSANGTFVNGEQVLAPVVLSAGDRLSFGDSTLVFHVAYVDED